MELINQHTKKIMEECKMRARDAGLSFNDETLEYIVTNRDMLELSPKTMIPTLYDYWVNDVEVLKGIGKYKLFPSNPYETVINSRPAISFYNDNNPDWLNIMIFYHVLAHIDFFQNNMFFEHTWGDDFVGQALADKRLIANLRSEYGRWVDYIIEFSRGIDNLVGYFSLLAKQNFPVSIQASDRIDFYFDVFLQQVEQVPQHEIFKEVGRYNDMQKHNPDMGDSAFFADIKKKYPEFQALFERYKNIPKKEYNDIMEFIMLHSPYLNKEENSWMKSVISIVRDTSIYFAPQIRTKTINEGWASYWHDKLFRSDDRISGHESAYAKVNAGVTSISRVGLNPYAIGLRLIENIEEMADKGKISRNFQKINDIELRESFNKSTGNGQETIFKLRESFTDFMLFNTYVDQDFVDRYQLFVTGRRMNQQRGTIEYYVKSRKAEDYKKMLIDSLYHPPVITIDLEKTDEDKLYLIHKFEGKQLYKPYIAETLLGIEFLWGGQVQLETHNIVKQTLGPPGSQATAYEKRKVIYTMKDRKLSSNKG